jgi:type I restriction enzyme R subunit
METTNFNFLKKHETLFFQLATTAEKAFSADPNTTLLNLAPFGRTFMPQHIPLFLGYN